MAKQKTIRDLNHTLKYRHLRALEKLDHKAYEEYSKFSRKTAENITELDTIRNLYTAYLCGLIEDGKDIKDALDIDEYSDLLPYNRSELMDFFMEVNGAKNYQASANAGESDAE